MDYFGGLAVLRKGEHNRTSIISLNICPDVGTKVLDRGPNGQKSPLNFTVLAVMWSLGWLEDGGGLSSAARSFTRSPSAPGNVTHGWPGLTRGSPYSARSNVCLYKLPVGAGLLTSFLTRSFPYSAKEFIR